MFCILSALCLFIICSIHASTEPINCSTHALPVEESQIVYQESVDDRLKRNAIRQYKGGITSATICLSSIREGLTVTAQYIWHTYGVAFNLLIGMTSSIHHRQLEFVMIGSDLEKADQLRINLRSTVHHFPSVLPFIDFLAPRTNASEYIILLISAEFISNLSPDMKQRVRGLYIYTDDPNDESYQTFKDTCLILRGLVIEHCIAEFVWSRLSNNTGLAKATVIQNINLTKSQIQDLQDICDELDKQEQCGQEVANSS